MQLRPLGNTGLNVSPISLGTVELGVDYGIQAPGEYGRLGENDAIEVIREAVAEGINYIDTAPTYGDSERLIGKALNGFTKKDVIISTKVMPAPGVDVQTSLDESCLKLGRSVLDIVQLHNATPEMIRNKAIMGKLLDAKQRGIVGVIGATVYGEDDALAVIRSGHFEVIQVAYSLLDQRMARRMFQEAHDAGIGVVVRSAFLKGALTPKAQFLPDSMADLRSAATMACERLAGGDWLRLPEIALRFCLSAPDVVSSVLAGIRTRSELRAAVKAGRDGSLDSDALLVAEGLKVNDESLVDPRRWPFQ